ncbi:MAG: hypothetical protein ACRDIY_12740, partial [Chloroflexota bacterium]
MASVTRERALPARGRRGKGIGTSIDATLGYLRRNPTLIAGIGVLLVIVLFILIGHLTVDVSTASPLSVRPLQPPSWGLPFGTDKDGRNLYAVMVVGTPMTIQIGVMAGVIGVTVGTTLALFAAFYGGWADTIIRTIVDIGLTIPGLVVLVILAMN